MQADSAANADSDICFAPATRLARLLRDGVISSRELLDIYTRRLAELNPLINAVVTMDLDQAHDAAFAADNTRARTPGLLGVLHGLPITVKDAITVRGLRSTGGATELADYVPDSDAPAVATLRKAGAIVFAKTNVPRWCADIQTHNEIFGVTNNPWDISRTVGGSSGGSAAATCAGLTSFDLGTDLGGSIRIPASFCGVFGHKPTYGVVDQRGYLDCARRTEGYSLDVDMNVFGPIARSAADLEMVMRLVANTRHLYACTALLGDLRFGVLLDDDYCPVDGTVAETLSTVVRAIAPLARSVRSCRPPGNLADMARLCSDLTLAAVSLSQSDLIGDRIGGLHRRWLAMQEQRRRLRLKWSECFEEFDVVLCPATPSTAFAHAKDSGLGELSLQVNDTQIPAERSMIWTQMASLAYLPATVVPAGLAQGLPVGVQVIGPYLGDGRCLKVARELERIGFEALVPSTLS